MSLLELFYWLEYTPWLIEMRSSAWLFPIIATIHLFGLTLIGAGVLIVDLRLLGLGLSRQPASRLAREVEPLLLSGLAIMFVTGPLLFMCFATKYYYLTAFWTKLASLLLILCFTFTIRRRVINMGETGASRFWAKPVAVISLSLWLSVVLGGRLIGFP